MCVCDLTENACGRTHAQGRFPVALFGQQAQAFADMFGFQGGAADWVLPLENGALRPRKAKRQ